jgi:hypothetical protein
MKRRTFLGSATAATALATQPVLSTQTTHAAGAHDQNDRAYMVDLLVRMARPVVGPMSQGKLHSQFDPELSPTWDGRDRRVAYLEAFGRLVAGIAPWLRLPDDQSAEGMQRSTMREQVLSSYAHSVDPKSPDYLLWRGEGQPLVDSAYFTNALLRAPKALWEPLERRTQERIVQEIKSLRRISPPYTNWLLFAAMNEAFLLSIGEQWDPMRIDLAVRKINEWYVGDGWYADGSNFHFDYYGSYVIHPMLVEILQTLVATGAKFNSLDAPRLLETALKRMQRYAECLERMVGPDGSYPAVGRSLTYRTAVFQPLALLAWQKKLPASLPEGQVRAACLAAQRAVFGNPTNFDERGYLTIGFAGHQPQLGDWYSNAGSMYIAASSLLALGLPADDSFWTLPAQPWTMKRAFAGEPFAKDYYIKD